ncbi:uncharacterized protein LOC62_04G006197 [Vanrija pseudolonga]|uniref:Uncharacterized protein n=1 Tax=Vanrija pseudolonga TaxID=143232 RepID=A0AAF0Y9M2_9TREE|nr:hypothetical protein LOC62_04G006197 [Vanrija pseudolonga]
MPPTKRGKHTDDLINKRLLNEHLASRGLPEATYDIYDYTCRRAPDRSLHEAVVRVTDESGAKRQITSSIQRSGGEAVEQASFAALCHLGAADTLVDMITAGGDASSSFGGPALIPAARLPPPPPRAPVQKTTFVSDGTPLAIHLPGRSNELFRTVLVEHGARLVELADAHVVLLSVEPGACAVSVHDRDVYREASSRRAVVLSDKWALLSAAMGKRLGMNEYMILY